MAEFLQRLGAWVVIPTPHGDPYVLAESVEEQYGRGRAVCMAKCVIFSFDPALREVHMPPDASSGNLIRVTSMSTVCSTTRPLMLLMGQLSMLTVALLAR